jgi:hypothetical protein
MIRTKRWFIMISALACLLLTSAGAVSEDEIAKDQEDSHVFAMLMHKTQWSDIDAYLELYKQEWMPLVKQNDLVLGHWIYQHAWGPDWTILIVEEFESLSSMGLAHEKFDELWEKKYPDKSERAAADKAFSDLVSGHSDAIVTERPGFTK